MSNLPVEEFSKRLNVCWICRKLLADSGGDPHTIRHEHHIVPRAYGGTDGPTVTLCTGHHTLMHNVALKLISNRSYFNLTLGMKAPEMERLLFLATRVQIAHDYASGDPNKRFPVVLGLDNQVKSQLDQLTNFYKLSRQNVIKRLITNEFNRVFQRR
jgi:hypothetical protein